MALRRGRLRLDDHLGAGHASRASRRTSRSSLCGFGFGLALAPVNAALLASTHHDVHGLASAFVVVARMVGMLVGISALTTIGLRRYYAELEENPLPSPREVCDGKTRCTEFSDLLAAAGIPQEHTVFAGAAICAVVAGVLALGALPLGQHARARRRAATPLRRLRAARPASPAGPAARASSTPSRGRPARSAARPRRPRARRARRGRTGRRCRSRPGSRRAGSARASAMHVVVLLLVVERESVTTWSYAGHSAGLTASTGRSTPSASSAPEHQHPEAAHRPAEQARPVRVEALLGQQRQELLAHHPARRPGRRRARASTTPRRRRRRRRPSGGRTPRGTGRGRARRTRPPPCAPAPCRATTTGSALPRLDARRVADPVRRVARRRARTRITPSTRGPGSTSGTTPASPFRPEQVVRAGAARQHVVLDQGAARHRPRPPPPPGQQAPSAHAHPANCTCRLAELRRAAARASASVCPWATSTT